MEPDDLPCSRNARPQKALVGRAQLKINQPPSLKRTLASLEVLSVTSFDGRSGTNTGVIPLERKEQAWNDQLDGWCSFDVRTRGPTRPPLREIWNGEKCAGKDSLATSLGEDKKRTDHGKGLFDGLSRPHQRGLDDVHESNENVPQRFWFISRTALKRQR